MVTISEHFFTNRLTSARETEFFDTLVLANGVYKTTADHRLDDLNDLVLSRWRATAFSPNRIMDVGVSSGITTAEWLEALTTAGFSVRMVGTDLSLSARLVPLWPGAYALRTADDHLIGVFGPTSIERWRNRRGYGLVRRLADHVAAHRNATGEKLQLLSPRALRCDGIEWVEDDVLSANATQFRHRFEVIRAANILNHCYFSADQLSRAVANLKERLTGPGAQLIVNRTLTDDGSNHATLFRLAESGRFEREARLGEGSEIEDLVLRA